MKTLHFYLTRQVLVTLVMTVIVFTFVLLLGNVMKEILTLLVSGQVTLGIVLKAIGLLIPYVMAYVLPFGMLTATLLVFGRLSADLEITAARASGISLIALVTPILLLGLILSGLCGFFNLWFAPTCRGAYKNLIYQLGARSLSTLITEDRFIDEIPGLILYVRSKKGDELKDVRLYQLQTNVIVARISAERGKLISDPTANKISFELFNGISEWRMQKRAEEEFGPPPAKPFERPVEWEWHQGQFGQMTTEPYDLSPLLHSERKPKVSEMTFGQLLQERANLEAKGVPSMPVRVQMHRQLAFSFACFAFTLTAIPLAIRAHRRETSIGVAFALLLVLLYYSFMLIGDALRHREALNPHLILWVPNFAFEIVGCILLYRANRVG